MFWWDASRFTASLWRHVLELPHAAWDVYLVYAPDAVWGVELAPPRFWMHRIRGLHRAPFLNQARLEAEVKALLSRAR